MIADPLLDSWEDEFAALTADQLADLGWDPRWDAGFDPGASAPPPEAFDPDPAGFGGAAAMSLDVHLAQLGDQLAAVAAAVPTAVHDAAGFLLIGALDRLAEAANTIAACESTVVAELERRPTLLASTGFTTTARFLANLLRLRPADAKRRVVVAGACATGSTLTGEPLPPPRPHVAAALAGGGISRDHAHVIDRALDAMPAGLPVEVLDTVEEQLVQAAADGNPTDVAALARDIRARLDPDGPEPRDDRIRRNRYLTIGQDDADDGAASGFLRGTLTPQLLAKLQTVLDPLAAPRPADDQGEDTRCPGQRMHDALEDLCDRFLRAGTLPDTGGVPVTVSVTISLRDLESRTGRAHTSHGGDLSVAQLLDLAAEAELIPVVLNDAGGIMSYGRTRRLATAHQTKALRARDRGCSFPGCTTPPEWCQRHHVEEWREHLGETDVGTMTLLCGHHHRNFARWGWTCQMVDGVPWWSPPVELDPDRIPRKNHAHRLPFGA